MNQLDFINNPELLTSDLAYQSIQDIRSTLCKKVYQYIEDIGGATCDEAELGLGISHQTCSARFNDLKKQGLIEASGKRRPTRSGRMANVYNVDRSNALCTTGISSRGRSPNNSKRIECLRQLASQAYTEPGLNGEKPDRHDRWLPLRPPASMLDHWAPG